MLIQRARDNLAAVLFCNTVGGQDELVFDGHSVAIDQDGEILARAPQFEESLTLCTIDPGAVAAARLRDTRHREAARGASARRCPCSPRSSSTCRIPARWAAAWPSRSRPRPRSTAP